MDQITRMNGIMKHDASARDRREPVNACKRRFMRQDTAAVLIFFAVLVLTPALPTVKGWMVSQASLVIIYVIAAMGIAILVGYTGLVSVGHGGFLAIGAYTSALLTKYFAVDLIVGLFGAMMMSALFGALLALVFLRLSGAFMAIGTLGFAFFVGTVVNNVPIFEGRDGIHLPHNIIFGMEIGDFGFYYVALASLALVTLFVYCLVNSGTGRAFMALRDSEKAAMSSGVNRLLYRTLAFSISAGITGIAGALNGHIVNYISAEVYADIWFSVDILMAVVVGGPAILFGPYLGGAFVVMLPFFLEELADFAFILKGVVLILVLRFAQAGVGEVLLRPLRHFRRRKLLAIGGARVD
jgi:branched-chain amino acid transport system permease protein